MKNPQKFRWKLLILDNFELNLLGNRLLFLQIQVVVKAYHINLNLYHYAGNNPVRYVDPDGRMAEVVTENPSFGTGVCIVLGTIGEDIVTLGVGLADDPATIALGLVL